MTHANEVQYPPQLPNYSEFRLPSYNQSFEPVEGIPTKYQKHTVVFSEKASQHFPPARNEDHAINLKPDAPASIDCKVYPLTPQELEALKVFLDEERKKGYIIESNSPYASSFFFIKKKDGKLQPILDYRPLNSWTIRDIYPLPLINTILEQLQGKKIFTKFNIHWGYNNIRIREDDQGKQPSKPPLGSTNPASCILDSPILQLPFLTLWLACSSPSWINIPANSSYTWMIF